MTKSNGKRILLVDDDKLLLDMYSIKFREAGFEVLTAPSGKDAIQQLTEQAVSVVLLDVVMPSMTGFEILEEIRAKKLGGDTVVIMLTNQSQESDKDRAEALGVDGYIVKASTIPSEVLEEVEAIMSSKQ